MKILIVLTFDGQQAIFAGCSQTWEISPAGAGFVPPCLASSTCSWKFSEKVIFLCHLSIKM
jgi:hypothetical protein